MGKKKIIRVTTVPLSLKAFCDGMLKELSEKYEVVAVSSPGEDLDLVAEREGVRTIAVPMERHISIWKDCKSLVQMTKVLRKEKPYMVHSMTPKAGLVTMIAGKLAGVPVRVHTFTGLVWPTAKGLQRRILMMTDWITCACATHVIPEGQGVLEDLQNHITKKPMKVLGYGNIRGIDLEYWRKSETIQEKAKMLKESDDSVFTFLFVGRIVGDKGINELVKAFAKYVEEQKQNKDTMQKCRLVLVGRYEEDLDPVKPETLKLIDTIDEIQAVGPQYGDDLLAWYAATDCFVFPSYREGFPNTVIEAGAMELASIVTDINGAREIISKYDREQLKSEKDIEAFVAQQNRRLDPGEKMSIRSNGVVIPSKDEDAIYNAMLWMIEHPKERKKMGVAARQMVADRFEQGFVREQLYKFYREVLGE